MGGGGRVELHDELERSVLLDSLPKQNNSIRLFVKAALVDNALLPILQGDRWSPIQHELELVGSEDSNLLFGNDLKESSPQGLATGLFGQSRAGE